MNKKLLILIATVLIVGLVYAADDEKKKVECPVIGIDLGTTYSCVGVYKKNQVEIIPNELGHRITPSVVAFTDEERLVGESAKNQAVNNPTRTLYDVKRLIGRKYTDKTVQYDKKFLPYEIIEKNGKPYIKVDNVRGETKVYAAEEISAMVLVKMKVNRKKNNNFNQNNLPAIQPCLLWLYKLLTQYKETYFLINFAHLIHIKRYITQDNLKEKSIKFQAIIFFLNLSENHSKNSATIHKLCKNLKRDERKTNLNKNISKYYLNLKNDL